MSNSKLDKMANFGNALGVKVLADPSVEEGRILVAGNNIHIHPDFVQLLDLDWALQTRRDREWEQIEDNIEEQLGKADRRTKASVARRRSKASKPK